MGMISLSTSGTEFQGVVRITTSAARAAPAGRPTVAPLGYAPPDRASLTHPESHAVAELRKAAPEGAADVSGADDYESHDASSW
jgi:hypothetical protein